MNKESIIIKLGRVLYPKSVIFSQWQVDEPIRIPVRKGRVPIPLWSPCRQECATNQRTRLGGRLGLLAALAWGLCASLSAHASQSVSLAWNPSTDSSTTGYIVYAGNSTTNYTSQMYVGTNTSVTVSGLTEGTTNYFAVSSYNSARVAGTPSAPISYLVPGLVVMTPGANGARPSITFPTAPGHSYEIQASLDLKVWTTILQTPVATSNAWTTYADPRAAGIPTRFYRLIMN